MERNILFVIAPEGFRDEEYFEPKHVLEEKGFDVTTASTISGVATGKLGASVEIDTTLDNINPEDFQALLFAGGPGAKIFQKDQSVHELIMTFFNEEKLIGAICVAPTIFAYSGVLQGKNATVWNSEENQKILEENGCNYIELSVVRDGNIITAEGPSSATEFGEKIVKYFEKEE